MWTFDALISVANTQKVQLEEQLYSNNILKSLLLQQGLHISNQQVNVQQDFFHVNSSLCFLLLPVYIDDSSSESRPQPLLQNLGRYWSQPY